MISVALASLSKARCGSAAKVAIPAAENALSKAFADSMDALTVLAPFPSSMAVAQGALATAQEALAAAKAALTAA